MLRPVLKIAILIACVLCVTLMGMTYASFRGLPETLEMASTGIRKVQIVDRSGAPLSITYQNAWNLYDTLPLHDIPLIFQRAFVESEDKRFFDHGGVDWLARFHALVQNLRSLRVVRGASTITEQVVRMLHPRPRTVWSRWVEGFEAMQLERRFSKAAILEFYLNQVPYARQRRGVLQAAHLYFNRDLDTLNLKEMLALVVLVRSPSGMDLSHRSRALARSVRDLAQRLAAEGIIDRDQLTAVSEGPLRLQPLHLSVEAGHFVQHLLRSQQGAMDSDHKRMVSTLDGSLQVLVQDVLDRRLKDLHSENVTDGAVLVIDHRSDQVLAWVNGGGLDADRPGGWIDAVMTPRQPGSTLKPFLYGLALEKGWTAATCIDDSPLAEPVQSGLHTFRNYSGVHYGFLRLREALGNSLNIPALRTIQFIGIGPFLDRLHDLGFRSLERSPEFYGEGLALGDGEVSLFELVRAYAVIARGGLYRPLCELLEPVATGKGTSRRVFSEEVASIIGSILSDPEARRLEFGAGNILNLPVQTAVKTGTSSDHRDAWAVGFSHAFTVGVWMGNLDRRSTRSITGTTGPGLVLRSVFAELNRHLDPEPLHAAAGLESVPVCRVSGLRASERCPRLDEWFMPGTAPTATCRVHQSVDEPGPESRRSAAAPANQERGQASSRGPQRSDAHPLTLLQPTEGLRVAMDPRIPDSSEALALRLPRDIPAVRTQWLVDGAVVGTSEQNEHACMWPVSRGAHSAQARVWLPGAAQPVETPIVSFEVR